MTLDEVAGVSRSLISGQWNWPVHGLRHLPTVGTSAWYVWTGELLPDDDFFSPWHHSHLIERCPEIRRMLALPAGTRFLIAPGYEDVWRDESLLDV